MFINKNFTVAQVWQFSGRHLLWILPWMILVAVLYDTATQSQLSPTVKPLAF